MADGSGAEPLVDGEALRAVLRSSFPDMLRKSGFRFAQLFCSSLGERPDRVPTHFVSFPPAPSTLLPDVLRGRDFAALNGGCNG